MADEHIRAHQAGKLTLDNRDESAAQLAAVSRPNRWRWRQLIRYEEEETETETEMCAGHWQLAQLAATHLTAERRLPTGAAD